MYVVCPVLSHKNSYWNTPDILILIFNITWSPSSVVPREKMSGCKSLLWRQCSFPRSLFLVIIITNTCWVGRNVQYSCKYWHRTVSLGRSGGVRWESKPESSARSDVRYILLQYSSSSWTRRASVLNWCKILEVPLCLSLLLSCQKYYFHPDSRI